MGQGGAMAGQSDWGAPVPEGRIPLIVKRSDFIFPIVHQTCIVHTTVVMDVPEIIGLYNVKSILTDNSI